MMATKLQTTLWEENNYLLKKYIYEITLLNEVK